MCEVSVAQVRSVLGTTRRSESQYRRVVDKQSLNERDICTKFITPALRRAGWDEISQIREEVCLTSFEEVGIPSREYAGITD